MEKRLTVFNMLQPKSQPAKIIFKVLFFQLRLQNRHLFKLCFLFFQLSQFFLQCLGTWTRNQSVHCSLYLLFNLIQPLAAIWFSIHIRGIDLVQPFCQRGNLLFCEKGLQGIYHHLLQFVCMDVHAVFYHSFVLKLIKRNPTGADASTASVGFFFYFSSNSS